MAGETEEGRLLCSEVGKARGFKMVEPHISLGTVDGQSSDPGLPRGKGNVVTKKFSRDLGESLPLRSAPSVRGEAGQRGGQGSGSLYRKLSIKYAEKGSGREREPGRLWTGEQTLNGAWIQTPCGDQRV